MLAYPRKCGRETFFAVGLAFSQGDESGMPPIPASELYSIGEPDLRDAIKSFREDALPSTFRDSTRFDLLVDGHRRYPPKAIVALAAFRPLGRVLSSDEFKGGESSSIFRLLIERSFAIATKPAKVGGLDATFSVGRDLDTEFVLIESKGADRNVDYMDGLEAVLRGLADRDASIDDIVIDSTETRHLQPDQRQLVLRSYTYPIQLRLHDIGRSSPGHHRNCGCNRTRGSILWWRQSDKTTSNSDPADGCAYAVQACTIPYGRPRPTSISQARVHVHTWSSERQYDDWHTSGGRAYRCHTYTCEDATRIVQRVRWHLGRGQCLIRANNVLGASG